MDELNNGEQGQYVEPGKNEKKNNTRKIVKRTLLTAGLALAVYMVYSIVYLFISPDRNIQQIYLVPEDAAFIIQSSAPIEDWEKFSGSETWQCLRKAKSFEEVAKSVEKLDSVVKSNKDSDKAIIFASKSIYNHDETLKVLGFCSMSGKSFPGLRTKRL